MSKIEKLNKAIDIIKAECESQESCLGCPFNGILIWGCTLNGITPLNWKHIGEANKDGNN